MMLIGWLESGSLRSGSHLRMTISNKSLRKPPLDTFAEFLQRQLWVPLSHCDTRNAVKGVQGVAAKMASRQESRSTGGEILRVFGQQKTVGKVFGPEVFPFFKSPSHLKHQTHHVACI